MPLIAGAVARGAVKPVGCEDVEELTAEGCAMAAAMLDSAEAKGKAVAPSSVAYYTLQALKSGRRSGYAGRTDAMGAGTILDGNAQLRSIDEGIADNEEGGDEMTLHDVLAGSMEEVDIEAARRIDWNLVLDQLDERRRVVLKCTAEGYGTDEIASTLKVSSPRVCQLRESIGPYIIKAWGTTGLASGD